jgi:hypothetical protein
MATKVVPLSRRDPFAVIGDAVAAAADAMKKGTADARQAASQAVPTVRSGLAKSIYVATYYGAYGVVLAGLAMGALDNAFGYGIRDGAAAARDARSNGTPRSRSVKTRPARRVAARTRTTRRRLRTRKARSAASVADAES